MGKRDLRWTQDTDYIWHACDINKQIGTTLCGQIEAARSGIFKYPKYSIGLSDLCKKCNQESGANYE